MAVHEGLRRIVFGASAGRAVVRGLVLGLLLLVASRTLVIPIRATGISMLPTFGDGQLLFFNALVYRWAAPSRGDIVAVALETTDAVLVKRVVALPGERVRIADGHVLVDDVVLDEPYLRYRSRWNVDEVVLGPDEYLVIGDNRAMPSSHHTFGAVPRARLRARLIF